MKKKLLICSLICTVAFALTGCGIDKSMLFKALQAAIQKDPDGAKGFNEQTLEQKLIDYEDILNGLLNLDEDVKKRYMDNGRANIDTLKKAFVDGSVSNAVINENIVWMLSPSLILKLYNEGQALFTFMQMQEDMAKHKISSGKTTEGILSGPCYTYLNNHGVIDYGEAADFQTNYQYSKYLTSGERYKDNIKNSCDKIKAWVSSDVFKTDSGGLLGQLITGAPDRIIVETDSNFNGTGFDGGQASNMYGGITISNSNSQIPTSQPASDRGNNFAVNINPSNSNVNTNKVLDMIKKNWSKTEERGIASKTSGSFETAQAAIDDIKDFTDECQLACYSFRTALYKAGKFGGAYTYRTITEELKTRSVDGVTEEYKEYMCAVTIVCYSSPQLNYDNDCKKLLNISTTNNNNSNTNYQVYSAMTNKLREIAPFLVDGDTIQESIAAADNEHGGVPTLNSQITDTTSGYNSDMGIPIYEFVWSNQGNISELQDYLDGYKQKSNAQNVKSSDLGKLGRQILINSRFFRHGSEYANTGSMFRPSNASNQVSLLDFNHIFECLISGKTEGYNKNVGDDFIVMFANIPICGIRLNEIDRNAQGKESEAIDESNTKGYMSMKYNSEDDKKTNEALVKTWVSVNVLNEVNGEGFETVETNMVYDLLEQKIYKAADPEDKNAGQAGNQKITPDNLTDISAKFPLNVCFYAAEPGSLLLLKYYPLYQDNTSNGDSSKVYPLGRPLYLNKENIKFESGNSYTWRSDTKPFAFLSNALSDDLDTTEANLALNLGAIKDKTSGAVLDGYTTAYTDAVTNTVPSNISPVYSITTGDNIR